MLLLERGANIEEVNDEGYTPLMEAAREGHEEMVALLLSQVQFIANSEKNMLTVISKHLWLNVVISGEQSLQGFSCNLRLCS